jgi:prepilin-type N-terminal cleavage/methylation domain-containing protein
MTFYDSKAARRGFTLLEMVCVMILLVVVGGIMVLLLKETLDVESVQAEGYHKILRNNALADQFRADVAGAEAAPEAWGKYKSDARTLILRSRNGHVVYLQQAETWLRRSLTENGASERALPVDGEDARVEFAHAGPGLIRMRLFRMRGEEPLPGQTLNVDAALGGDRR